MNKKRKNPIKVNRLVRYATFFPAEDYRYKKPMLDAESAGERDKER